MNKRKQRQEQIRNIAKELGKDIESFESGAKWADYHPNWKEGIPKPEMKHGLPKLYLCQILTLDMTFGYRYSYRIGFVSHNNVWNIENTLTHVTRYMEIFCDESDSQLLQKDIPAFEEKEKKEEEETKEAA